MFDWLFEGHLAIYLLLATGVVLFVGLWWRDRKKHWLVPAGAFVLLMAVYFLLSQLVETGRKQIERSLHAMARGVKERKPEDVLAHVSEQFNWEGLSKQEFAEILTARLHEPLVDDLVLSDIRVEPWPPPKGQPARVTFKAWVKGGRVPQGTIDPPMMVCQAEFVRDPDKKWRLRDFKVFLPLSTDPISVRGYLR